MTATEQDIICPDSDFVFVIGSPRSGTTWLRNLLGEHPQSVRTEYETTEFSAYVAPIVSSWDRENGAAVEGRFRKGMPTLFRKEELEAATHRFLAEVYRRILQQKPEARVIVCKTPENAFHVGLIHRFLPRAKFIHIIRDGRDVFCSMRNAHRNLGHEIGELKRAVPLWARSVRRARDAKEYGQDHYLELRYEDLVANTPTHLTNLFEFCGLPATTQLANEIAERLAFSQMKQQAAKRGANLAAFYKGKAGGWSEEMTASELRQFARHSGDLLVELGYATPEWVSARVNAGRLGSFLSGRLYHFLALVFGERLTQAFWTRSRS